MDDLDSARAVLLTLSHAATTINRLVRTQALVPEEKLFPDIELQKNISLIKSECPELREELDQLYTPENLALLFPDGYR